MKKIGFLILVLLFLVSGNNYAQESINTDRPDQSDGVYTVPKQKFQLENGITAANEIFLTNFMLRYGVTNTAEVRLLVDTGNFEGKKGLKPIGLSVKQRISQQRKIVPAITFVGTVSYEKLASTPFQSTRIPVELKLAFENEITNNLTIGYNVGSADTFKTFVFTTNLCYALTDKTTAFLEYFGSTMDPDTEHNLNTGLLFVFNPQLQLDIACGSAANNLNRRLFTTFGFSYIFE